MKRRGFLKALAGGVAAALVAANTTLTRAEPPPPEAKPDAAIEDLRGKPLTLEDIEEGMRAIRDAPNYGSPYSLVLSPQAKQELAAMGYPV